MKMRLVILTLLAASLTAPALAAGKLYRFKIDGKVILKDRIPAEYTTLGYDVLSAQGLLIESVPPAPTPEERAEKKALESAQEARVRRIAQQRQEDLKLLRLYERPEDVERARKRKIEEINTYIALLRRRLDGLEEKLREAQADAKRISDSGREVPDVLAGEIRAILDAQDDVRRDVQDRQAEFGRITRQYAEQYERVRILQLYPPGTLYDEVDFGRVDRANAAR